MSHYRNWFRTVVVTPLPSKNHPIIYRASYKRCVSYGRTAQKAVENVNRRYRRTRLTPLNILDQVAATLWPF